MSSSSGLCEQCQQIARDEMVDHTSPNDGDSRVIQQRWLVPMRNPMDFPLGASEEPYSGPVSHRTSEWSFALNTLDCASATVLRPAPATSLGVQLPRCPRLVERSVAWREHIQSSHLTKPTS